MGDIILVESENRLDVAMLPILVPPPIDYSGKHEWCAYRIYHELPGRQATTWVVTETYGKIGNLSVQLTKAGLAGVEATFQVNTGEETVRENIAVEVLGWWQYGKYLTGLCIYDYNKEGAVGAYVMKEISPGEMLDYRVSVFPGSGVLTKVWDSGGKLIFENLYKCDAKRIVTLQTELEYWRYCEKIGEEYIIREGRFNFVGEVILEKLYQEGVGWKNVADVTSYYLTINATEGICDPRILMSYDHYKQGGSWVFKGKVIDIV